MVTLYEFSISHFCEKVRWALDFKKIKYKRKTLVPGLHMAKVKQLSTKSSVPILVDGDRVVQESSEIITYLDNTYEQRGLTPADKQLREQALEWERFADEHIGIHVRRLCYDTLLEHPKIIVPFFTNKAPFYTPFLIRAMLPKLNRLMRKYMRIDNKGVAESIQALDRAVEKVNAHLSTRRFIVGDTFTRADLTLAALLSPLTRASGYGFEWPVKFPEPLESHCVRYAEQLPWVDEWYQMYRCMDDL